MSPPLTPPPSSPVVISPADYAHSPVHHAVTLADLPLLTRLLSHLPRPSHPASILTPADAALQDHLSTRAAPLLDRRDGIPLRDTPLHLAVRLSLPLPFATLLLSAGADPSLQNSHGWTPLHLSLAHRNRPLSHLLLRHHRLSAHHKFRRRLPPLLAALRPIPDAYLELSFRFESSLLPFFSRAAPSDTYRVWKRHDSLRADTSLAGFDGLRVRRADRSFLFLASHPDLPFGSLLVLDRSRREVRDAFDDADINDAVDDDTAYRPGLDITTAELVPCTNWRGKEKVETVGEWKAKAYDVENVVFSFKTMRADPLEEGNDGELSMLPLELTEDAEDGFLVAELPVPPRHSCYGPPRRRESFEEIGRRRSVDLAGTMKEKEKEKRRVVVGKSKEKEVLKNLRPTVWLTEDFPLKTEEFLPLLDILATKVKAVRRLRELLTTKFPPGTFPVKVAIPVVPTVRVVVTFTKFAHLQPSEEFFTPLSSPQHLSLPEEEDHLKAVNGNRKSSWLKWNNNSTPKTTAARSKSMSTSQVVDHADPFTIPSDYTWVSNNSKSQRTKMSKYGKGKVKQMK